MVIRRTISLEIASPVVCERRDHNDRHYHVIARRSPELAEGRQQSNPNSIMLKDFKKISFFITVFILASTLSACKKSTPVPIEQVNINPGVVETGNIIDASGKNSQTINVVPGDLIYLKLMGEAKSGKQWTVISPAQGDSLSLKEQKVIGLDDKEILAGKFSSEWWLKVETKGEFDLQFDYGKLTKKAEQIFKIKVISQ